MTVVVGSILFILMGFVGNSRALLLVVFYSNAPFELWQRLAMACAVWKLSPYWSRSFRAQHSSEYPASNAVSVLLITPGHVPGFLLMWSILNSRYDPSQNSPSTVEICVIIFWDFKLLRFKVQCVGFSSGEVADCSRLDESGSWRYMCLSLAVSGVMFVYWAMRSIVLRQ